MTASSPFLGRIPLRLISPCVNEGQNTSLSILVNLWPNRLIGDSKLPKQERRTKNEHRKVRCPDSENIYERQLLGPVKIRGSFKQVKIEDL